MSLPAVLDEDRAVTIVAGWAAAVRDRSGPDGGRESLVTSLRRCLRNGLVMAIRVVEAADQGDEIADAALRQIGAELLERPSGSPGDLQILAYLQRAALRAPHRRKRGRSWDDDWRRNVAICLLIDLACKEFGVKPTRSRESRRAKRNPSGCSLVAAALARNDIFIEEKSIQNNIWLGLPGALMRQILAEPPQAGPFPYPNK